jgi:hypothetical protein
MAETVTHSAAHQNLAIADLISGVIE